MGEDDRKHTDRGTAAEEPTVRERFGAYFPDDPEIYADFFENANVPMHWVSSDGIVLRANEAELDALGYSFEEYIGHHIANFHADRDVIDDILDRLGAGEELVDYEARMVCKDGSIRHVLIDSSVHWQDGEFINTRCVTRDITERMARERDLARYKTVFDTIEDGIYVLGPDFRFVEVNDAYAEMTGYDKAELVGAHCSLVIGEEISDIAAEMAEAMVNDPDGSATLEAEVLTKDGSRFPAESKFTALPTTDSFRGSIGVVRDLTDRKGRERELEHRARQQQVIADLGKFALETGDIDAVMREAAGQVSDVLDTAYSKVLDLDPGEGVLMLREGVGWRDGIVGDATVAADDNSQAGYTLRSEQPVVVDDFASERRFSSPELLTSHDVVSGISTSIGSVEQPWGILGTHDTATRTFSDEDVAFVQSIANVLASAIDRAERQRELEEYERIVEIIDDGIYVNDEAFRFRLVNDAYAELMGCSREELIGSHVTAAVGEETLEDAEPLLSDISPGEGGTHEFEMETADGTRTIETKFVVLGDDAGEYAGSVGILRDLTDRKAAEQKLRNSEVRFRNLMEQAPFSIQIFDAEGWTVAVNPAWEQLWDAPREHLDDYNVLEDEQLEATGVLEYIRQAFAGEVVTLPITEYDPAEIGKPGRKRWIEGYTYPIIGDEGDAFEVAIVHHDITDRKRTEQALRESEARLQLALNVGELGAWELDLQTHESPIRSPEHDLIFGYDEPLEEWSFDRFLDHVHPDERERVKRSFDDAFETDDWAFECRIIRADGQERWIDAQGQFYRDEHDDPVRAVGIIQDVTERKEYERALERVNDRLTESNERLEQFAYAASHDMQEPLRTVSSYLQLLERRYAEELDTDAQDFIEFAVDGADRMRAMIQGLLEYARIETQGGSFEAVELEDVLEAVRESLQVRINESDAEITTETLPSVVGDPSQIQQVVQNLLSNAIEYSGDDPPRIHISAEQNGTEWIVAVRDEGIGIDPADQERIFEVFQRLHGPGTHRGAGIGLALCERIVERHGGDIWVESEAGEGATFFVTLRAANTT